MQHTLHEHFVFLEKTIQELRAQLSDPSRTTDERERIEFYIKLAEIALVHYRAALELERKIL